CGQAPRKLCRIRLAGKRRLLIRTVRITSPDGQYICNVACRIASPLAISHDDQQAIELRGGLVNCAPVLRSKTVARQHHHASRCLIYECNGEEKGCRPFQVDTGWNKPCAGCRRQKYASESGSISVRLRCCKRARVVVREI